MKRLHLFAVSLVLVSSGAWAWGPSTHAYVSSCVTDGYNLDVLFGAMLPDCCQIIRDNPTEAYHFNQLTHKEFDLLAPSALATGFKTHNGEWGADLYAHQIFSSTPMDIYSVQVIHQLMEEFDVDASTGENVFEMCVDVKMRLILGPEWGMLLKQAANASGAEHEQAMVDAYAAELATRSGLTQQETEEDIRNAVRGFKSLVVAFGEQLQLSEAEIHEQIPPLLAIYLQCDVSLAEAYYLRGIELTADVMTELERICGLIQMEMPNAQEGEDTWEGEYEGEGEGEPEVKVVDFCEAFQQVYENPLLQSLDPEFAAFVELLNPATADLNGDFYVDTSSGMSIMVTGNGMLDSVNELGLLGHLLNHPEPFHSGIRSTVIGRDEALTAWLANLAQLNRDIGPMASVLASAVPGLQKVLAGFLTLGDGEFSVTSAPTPEDPDAPIIASGSGSFGLVAALFATLDGMIAEELGSGFANPNLRKEDYVTLAPFLPDSDADGDGFSNKDEYDYFTPDICDGDGTKRHKGNDLTALYTAAALNYRVCPDCDWYCSDCTNPHGGLYEAGEDACLRVPGAFAEGTPFDWAKAGSGPLFGDRYEGVDCYNLRIYNLTEADSGTYVCTYGNEADTYNVRITVAESLPVASRTGQAWLLFAVLVAATTFALRVRKPAKLNQD